MTDEANDNADSGADPNAKDSAASSFDATVEAKAQTKAKEKAKEPDEPFLREHEFDGIVEYDQKLPNWWLFTLYGSIVFFVGFWIVFFSTRVLPTHEERLDAQLAQISDARAKKMLAVLDDANLWKMSADSSIIAEGKALYTANCVTCHAPDLNGKKTGPQYIGVSLIDAEWLYGEGKPTGTYKTVHDGSPDPTKGMPPWGPILGPEKVAKVVAYVMSHHESPPPADG